MTFLSLSAPPPHLPPTPPPHWRCVFFFFFHTVVTLLQHEQAMVNCLTFPIARRRCAVWSVSTRFSPVYQLRSVNAATFCLVGIGGVVRTHCVPPFWNLYSVCRFFFVPFSLSLATRDATHNVTRLVLNVSPGYGAAPPLLPKKKRLSLRHDFFLLYKMFFL